MWHQLDEKPKWFLTLNPLGKVPTLAFKEDDTTHSVYESNICNEFLEDYQSSPSLFASHPVRKARERMYDSQLSLMLEYIMVYAQVSMVCMPYYMQIAGVVQ